MSEARGSGLECQAATVQEPPSGVTPRLRSGAARRSHLAQEAKGSSWEEAPHT